MTGIDIFRIIVSKFSYRKELGQIIWFVINERSEISLHYTVFSLSLAINLRINSSEELLLNFQEMV